MGRVDKVVAFNPLEMPHYMAIFLKHIDFMNQKAQREGGKVPALLVTPRCVENFLAMGKFQYGATGLKRVIEDYIFSRLAVYVNSGVSLGKTVICDMTPEGKIVFHNLPESPTAQ